MQLVSIDSNPIPAGVAVQAIRTRDARILRGAYWQPTASSVKGTICLMQGRAEFIEKYFETIDGLRRRGFAVMAFDWRGQGGSERLLRDPRKGHVGSYAEYALDLRAVLDRMQELDAPQPFFGLAHSMGGTAALIALARGERRLARCLLSAPFIAIYEKKLPPGAGAIVELLGLAGLNRSYVPGGGAMTMRPFADNFLTSDQERYARMASILAADARIGIGAPTIGWLRASYRAFAEMGRLDFGFSFSTPLLFILAGGDTLVSSPAAAALAQRIKGAAVLDVPYARHEILMERDPFRAQFFAALDAFLPGEALSSEPVAASESAGVSAA